MNITVTQALKILELRTPFTMVELKKAYRTAALKSHPDCGGTNEDFIKVDAAYDLLLSCSTDLERASDKTYWERYWESELKDLQDKFVKEWRDAFKTAQSQKTGLWLISIRNSQFAIRNLQAYIQQRFPDLHLLARLFWRISISTCIQRFICAYTNSLKSGNTFALLKPRLYLNLLIANCELRIANWYYMYPRKEWFVGVLFSESSLSSRTLYREILLEIAPNQRLREQWALKYYRLEFGFDTPYIFYLPPGRSVSHEKAIALI